MPSAGFEPAIPAIERLQTYFLVRASHKKDSSVFVESLRTHCSVSLRFLEDAVTRLNKKHTAYVSLDDSCTPLLALRVLYHSQDGRVPILYGFNDSQI